MARAIGNIKECCRCEEIKSITEFRKKNRSLDGLEYYCKVCSKLEYEKNKERRREIDRKHYYANRKKRIARVRRYECRKLGSELPEHWAKYLAKPKVCMSHEEAIEHNRNQLREYKRRNKERYAKEYKVYCKTEKGRESNRLRTNRRRALEANLDASLSQNDILFLLDLQSKKCACCDKEFNDEFRYELDHIIPVSLGGGLILQNIQLLCRSCNASKGTKVIRYIPLIEENFEFGSMEV